MIERESSDEVPLLNAYALLHKTILLDLHKLHYDCTKTQFIIFTVLNNHGSLSMGEVAKHIISSKEQATRAVAPLVEDGYVERYIEPENRTRIHVRLTEKGKAYISALRRGLRAEIEKSLNESLSEDELTELSDAVETIVRLMGKMKG